MEGLDVQCFDVGVLVGRFQTDRLTEGHKKLFDFVTDRHKIVICLLGVAPVPSKKNPLDFKHRKQMIEEDYPNIIVLKIKDMRTNEQWSSQVDTEIMDVLNVGQRPLLYGSRDSFTSSYFGRFPTYAVEEVDFVSATKRRKEICNEYKSSPELRAGIIQGTANRYPTNYVTVDIAILDSVQNPTKILLGRKKDESQFRFIGGFSEPTSTCLEEDAMRECREEATECEDDNVKVVTFPSYICSMRIKDWRYRGLSDQICTTLFKTEWKYDGNPIGHDDIEEVKWFNLEEYFYQREHTGALNVPYRNLDKIVACHDKLMVKLLDNLADKFDGVRTV